MATPIIRDSAAANVSQTGANAVANSAYSALADALRIQLSALATPYLLADFRLTGFTFATAPTTGAIQLVKVPRDFSGNQGPTPAASMLPTQIWAFGPMPSTSNALKTWVMSVDQVPLDPDQDFWLYNTTGQSLPAGWTLTAQPWSPGT